MRGIPRAGDEIHVEGEARVCFVSSVVGAKVDEELDVWVTAVLPIGRAGQVATTRLWHWPERCP